MIKLSQYAKIHAVTYKTAWRMFHQIRKLLAEDINPLSEPVEADETYIAIEPDVGGVVPFEPLKFNPVPSAASELLKVIYTVDEATDGRICIFPL